MDQRREQLNMASGIHLCRLRDESARPWSYMAVAVASFVLVAAATVPTPLYQLYQQSFHFPDSMLTMIFGIYSFGVIPALLIFGPLGDVICRRRVLMMAICIAAAGIAVLASAQSVLWLLAGRLLVGVGVGATQGNSSAALVEMQPRGDRLRAGIMTTASTTGGAAAGTLASGLIAQYLPDPFVLAYLLELGMLTIALVLTASIREAASPVLSFVGFHRPRIPRNIAAGFMASSLTGGLVWAIAGLFLALVPSYVSNLLHTRHLAAGGALVALMLGSSIVAQITLNHWPAFRLQVSGLAGAAAGITAVVLAWSFSSLALMIAGSIVCGGSIGIAYLGSISEINRLASPQERGGVNSLYFVIIYLFFSLPTVALGFAAAHLGLYAAICTFAVVIVGLTPAAIIWLAIRQRSAPG